MDKSAENINEKIIIEEEFHEGETIEILEMHDEPTREQIRAKINQLKNKRPATDKISYKAAWNGMVLLENKQESLPLKEEPVALLGKGCFNYQSGGGGSAAVYCGDIDSLPKAFEKRKRSVIPESVVEQEEYSVELLNEWAKKTKIGVAMFVRKTGEGMDRPVSDYYLKDEEKELLENIEKSDFESVIVVLNIGSPIDVATIKSYKKVNGILLAWHAGMHGTKAIVDILYGLKTPSGRLADTFCKAYEDYPSAEDFDSDLYLEYYNEDIYVGYRYFEEYAQHKVLYPFGYGLSYTTFEVKPVFISREDRVMSVKIKVENTGKVAGREVVQLYIKPVTKENVVREKLFLVKFLKTDVLQPGEEKEYELVFDQSELCTFDEKKGEYVVCTGIYKFYCGYNVRDLVLLGIYAVEERMQFGKARFNYSNYMPKRIGYNGTLVGTRGGDYRCTEPMKDEPVDGPDCTSVSLIDVDEGRMTLDEFVSKLSISQLINLTYGKPASVIRGTGGIGNMPEIGIPNVQTADGPAGVRRTIRTTSYPCASLLACTWDTELLHEVGIALGMDCIVNDVDILLAPGLNIHRNPLCGRNFEYFSEDPVVSGMCAAAIVNGVQKLGVGATIKHFAANNRESNRKNSDSRMSERALRNIYLKGFEIAINLANPWCVMTSYNKLNGEYTSASRQLIEGILRDEWGYDGMVMSDWETTPELRWEVLAGNNVKMPSASKEDIEGLKRSYMWKSMQRRTLEENAKHILRMIMKTHRFKLRDFGPVTEVKENEKIEIQAVECTLVSHDFVGMQRNEKGENYVFNLGALEGEADISLTYRLNSEKEQERNFSAYISCDQELDLEVYVNDESQGKILCKTDNYDFRASFVTESAKIKIPKGISDLKVIFRGSTTTDSVHPRTFIIE